MTAREILAAVQIATQREQPSAEDRALMALRDLLVDFLNETDKGYPDSMKAMSIDQIRLLNQLHLAVGL